MGLDTFAKSLVEVLMSESASPVSVRAFEKRVKPSAFSNSPATSLFEPHYIEWCNEDGYYVRMLFEKPDIRFQVFYKTIATYFDEYWAGAFGNALGWQNIEVPPVLIYSWFLLMAVLFMKRKQEKTLLYTGDKLVVFGVASMTIAFILLAPRADTLCRFYRL